jgi:hypothetical protein
MVNRTSDTTQNSATRAVVPASVIETDVIETDVIETDVVETDVVETDPEESPQGETAGVPGGEDPTPVMAFTLIDGGASADEVEYPEDADDLGWTSLGGSVRAGSTDRRSAAPTVGGSSLRRILGTGGANQQAVQTDATDLDDTASTGSGREDGSSLLRPHPAEDRLGNEFTRVPSTVGRRHPSARRLGGRNR